MPTTRNPNDGCITAAQPEPRSRCFDRRMVFSFMVAGTASLLHPSVALQSGARGRPRKGRKRRNRSQAAEPIHDVTACSPPAMSGIAGLVLLGPMCPVVTQDDPCPDRPYAAALTVRDANGHEVCATRSGEDGRFRIGLPPGVYELIPEAGEFGLPYAASQTVTVLPNQYTDVLVSFDSGIR